MQSLFTVRNWLVVNLCALAVVLCSPLTLADLLADGAIACVVAAGWCVVAAKLPPVVIECEGEA